MGRNNSSSKILSPRGVTDFFQIHSDEVLKSPSKKKSSKSSKSKSKSSPSKRSKDKLLAPNFNDSFSWGDESASNLCLSPLGKPSSSSTRRTSKKDFKKSVKEIAKRLKWLEEQREKDKDEYAERLAKAKDDVRKDLEMKYGKTMAEIKKNSKEKSVIETQRVIQYLKDDNTKIRQEIAFHKKEISKMKKMNDSLEESNNKALDAVAEVREHIAEQEAIQAKLEENCTIFKNALKDMKAEYKKRDRHYRTELASASKLEAGIKKVMNHVKNNPSSHTYLEETYETLVEGGSMAVEGRAQAFAKAGIIETEEERTAFQNKLLDFSSPADRHAHDDKEYDSDSDSDSDDE